MCNIVKNHRLYVPRGSILLMERNSKSQQIASVFLYCFVRCSYNARDCIHFFVGKINPILVTKQMERRTVLAASPSSSNWITLNLHNAMWTPGSFWILAGTVVWETLGGRQLRAVGERGGRRRGPRDFPAKIPVLSDKGLPNRSSVYRRRRHHFHRLRKRKKNRTRVAFYPQSVVDVSAISLLRPLTFVFTFHSRTDATADSVRVTSPDDTKTNVFFFQRTRAPLSVCRENIFSPEERIRRYPCFYIA